ncbi:MAG: hypothetical protein PF517_10370 [Salinivirgaceae bacterium]|jgi:predicted metal-dependent hydrolase|nr:hypothetical protein [Salinivirgaceae bacterium]
MLIRSKADFKEKMSCLTKKESQKLNEVTTLTIQLMEKYGVAHYKFRYRYFWRFLGLCDKDTIALQLSFALNNTMEEIENTILHEIAHAIVGVGHGHRLKWQEKAIELGVTWKRIYHK